MLACSAQEAVLRRSSACWSQAEGTVPAAPLPVTAAASAASQPVRFVPLWEWQCDLASDTTASCLSWNQARICQSLIWTQARFARYHSVGEAPM